MHRYHWSTYRKRSRPPEPQDDISERFRRAWDSTDHQRFQIGLKHDQFMLATATVALGYSITQTDLGLVTGDVSRLCLVGAWAGFSSAILMVLMSLAASIWLFTLYQRHLQAVASNIRDDIDSAANSFESKHPIVRAVANLNLYCSGPLTVGLVGLLILTWRTS